jgi:hypothetical protein
MRFLEKAVCRWCCRTKVPTRGPGVRGSSGLVPWTDDDDRRWDAGGEVMCPTRMGTKSLSDAFEGCWVRGVHESGVLVPEGEEAFSASVGGGGGV